MKMTLLISEQATEDRGQSGFVELVTGNRDHCIVERIEIDLIGLSHRVVEREESKRRCDRCPFVAIEKRLGLRDVEGVAGGDFEDIAAAVKRSVDGRAKRRLHQTNIPRPASAAKPLQRFKVEFFDFCELEKTEHCPSLRESLKQFAIMIEYISLRLREVCRDLPFRLLQISKLQQGARDLCSFRRAHVLQLLFDFRDRHGFSLSRALLFSNMLSL